MHEKNDSHDFPAFDIFLKFFKLIFGFSPELKAWKFNPEKINQKHLILIFSWPGIIVNKLLFPNEKKEINKNTFELEELLKGPPEFEKLLKKIVELNKLSKDEKYFEQCEEFFEDSVEKHPDFQGFFNSIITTAESLNNNLLESKNKSESYLSKLIDDLSFDNPKTKNTAPISLSKFAIKIFFLYSMSDFIGNLNFRKLLLGIFYYYLIFFLFLKSLEDKSEEPLIIIQNIIGYLTDFHETYGDNFATLIPIFNNCIGPAISGLFGEAFNFLRNEDEKLFLNPEGLPLTDDKVHHFNNENPNYYACISPDTYNSDTNNTYYDIAIIREIQPIKEIDYKLTISIFKELFYGDFDGVCEFIGGDTGDKTVSEQLLFFLYHMTGRITFHMSSFIESWDEFIGNPAMIVDHNSDKFAQKMETVVNSYSLFDEFLDHKDLFRAIGTLDMEIDDEGIKKIRKEIKKTKKYHMSPELSEKLKEANNELNLLFTSVRGIQDYKRDKEAIKYFSNHPHQFEILQHDDIKDVLFTSEANAIRDARRKVLYRITKRYGKDLPPSRITKGLGLE